MSTLKTIFIIVLVVIVGLSICLFLGYKGIEPFTVFWSWTGDTVRSITGSIDLSNPGTILTTGVGAAGAAVAVGGPLLSKLNSAKAQAQQLADSAKTQLNSLTAEKDKITSQISGYETQIKGYEDQLKTAKSTFETQLAQGTSDLQKKVTDTQNLFNTSQLQKTELQTAYDKLKIQYTELKDLKVVK